MAKNLILPVLAQIRFQKLFLWVLPLLEVRHCYKLSLYVNSRKTMNQTRENGKKTSFGPKLNSVAKFFFQNLALPVPRYHGQLSSCTISEKN